MRILATALTMLLLAAIGCGNRSQPKSTASEAVVVSNDAEDIIADDASELAAQSDHLVVVARLVERPYAPVPHCGLLHVAELMRYEVVHVETGPEPLDTLWVAHGCPEMSRAMYDGGGTLMSFSLGAEHRLELSPPGTDKPSVVGGERLMYWWSDRADLVARL